MTRPPKRMAFRNDLGQLVLRLPVGNALTDEERLDRLHADAARLLPPGSAYWLLAQIPWRVSQRHVTVMWSGWELERPWPYGQGWRYDAPIGVYRSGPFYTPGGDDDAEEIA